VISRQRPAEWFALTPSALYQTEDAGRTWRTTLSAAAGETFRDLSVSFSRIMIAMTGGRGLCDVAGTAQTLPAGMGTDIYAVVADIRSDRFYVYDSAGATAYHSASGGTTLVAATALPAGCAAQQRGMWRDSQLAGLLYIAGGAGGAWKSVDGLGSSGGYFKVRQPGVQGAPSGAVYAQVGAGGSLVRAPMAAAVVVLSDTATRALPLWNGSGNNPEPAGWYGQGFDDSGWAAAIAAGPSHAPSTSIWATPRYANIGSRALFRRTFTIPNGRIAAADMTDNGGSFVAVWVQKPMIATPGSTRASGPCFISPAA